MPNYFAPMTGYGNMYPGQFQFSPNNYSSQQTLSNPGNNSQGILWVQGESGAKSFLVGAGQSVLLMDSESSTFYIKSSDNSGMPLPLRIFDYTERTSNQQVPPVQEHQTQAIDPNLFVTHEEFEKFKNEVLSRRKQQNNQPMPKEGQ